MVLNQGPFEQVSVAVDQVATRDGRAAAQGLAALVVVARAGREGGTESGCGGSRGHRWPLALSDGVAVRSHL